MHRKTPISLLVYNALFPSPSPTDPPSFSAHLSKNLVGEVRIETATFYGSLDTIEARYPGLNYAFPPHRKRLGRFPHHRRLFEAFDALRLTDSEIQGFCRWEGTLWARERYERDEGVQVRDTTGMEIGAWVDRRRTGYRRSREGERRGINVKTDIEVEIEDVHTQQQDGRTALDTEMHDHESSGEEEDDDEPDEPEKPDEPDAEVLDESVGFALNARLMQAAALRDQGHDAPMDPEWEQYLKEAQERGELNVEATREVLRSMAGGLVGELARVNASEGPSQPQSQSQSQLQQPYPPAAPA